MYYYFHYGITFGNALAIAMSWCWKRTAAGSMSSLTLTT